MESNQVIAALQIENGEVRLVVGQFYRDSFDIIAREVVSVKGLEGVRIVDEAKVLEGIRTAANNVSAKISAPLKSVLLIIPGHRFKREKRTYETLLDEHHLTYDDVREIVKEGYRSNVGHDYEIINVSVANYRINGITYPKLPLNEKGDMLTCDVDLICGDRITTYDYVSIVEKAGLKVIDICQDGYAASKEAALFEQSFNSYVINIYLSNSHSVYSLICNGRMVGGFSNQSGYDELIKPIMDSYSLSYRDASRLLFRYGHIGQQNGEDRLINRWKDGETEKSITYNELQQTIAEASQKMVSRIFTYCSKIVDYDNVSIIVSGNGAALQDLDKTLTERFGKNVICYCPDKLGVREPKWTALAGIFYEYKDMQTINQTAVCSVDMDVYKEHLLPKETEEENTLANRFKSITDKLFVDKNN